MGYTQESVSDQPVSELNTEPVIENVGSGGPPVEPLQDSQVVHWIDRQWDKLPEWAQTTIAFGFIMASVPVVIVGMVLMYSYEFVAEEVRAWREPKKVAPPKPINWVNQLIMCGLFAVLFPLALFLGYDTRRLSEEIRYEVE